MKYIVMPLLKLIGHVILFAIACCIVATQLAGMILYALWHLKYWNAFEGPFFTWNTEFHGTVLDTEVTHTFWDFVMFNWVEIPCNNDNDEKTT